MLEKIGLPAKPSMRGSNWVVDASHCQGCSSQFSFFNRKHHCRRCGGIFCNGCTQQRMILRGQGDAPVRICDPCKKLEDAVRFELRHGHRNRAAKGSLKLDSMAEEKPSNQTSQPESGSSSKETSELSIAGMLDEVVVPTSSEELRKKAMEEKNKYKILKAEGKNEEALRAFKRGKELERQAQALDIASRKTHKKATASSSSNSSTKPNLGDRTAEDGLLSELRSLGWADGDLHDHHEKKGNQSLEGELSGMMREVLPLDNSQVLALKKKALMLKREGNLADAKEELRKAKALERELEEQALLGPPLDESDDELAAIVRSLDDQKKDDVLVDDDHSLPMNLDFLSLPDDLPFDDNLNINEDDMNDPEMAAALKSFGWSEDDDEVVLPVSRENHQDEILRLKREALKQKRAGNKAEAMELLRKAKQYEQPATSAPLSSTQTVHKPKSRLSIQRELLAVKKKARALRSEGRFDEAEEELSKGKDLERQLEEMDSTKANTIQKIPENSFLAEESDDVESNLEVTEKDMDDPALLSALKNVGWADEDETPPVETVVKIFKSKGEIQRELLAIKRKALALRREGKTKEANEELEKAKPLEEQIKAMDEEILERETSTPLKTKSTATAADAGSLYNQRDDLSLASSSSSRLGKSPVISEEVLEREISTPLKTKPTAAAANVGSPGYQRDNQGSASSSRSGRSPAVSEEALERETSPPLKTKPTAAAPYVGSPDNQRGDPGSASSSCSGKSPAISEEILEREQSPPLKIESLGDQILDRKRKALALKREGKLAEAREELRQAKLLEKSLEDSQEGPTTSTSASSSAPVVRHVSARDRFKLQQEVLSHKRLALKLKREGRIEESTAESELAKSLEAQLEEMDNSKVSSSGSVDVNTTDGADLLDPQLLSALKSIGWGESEIYGKIEPTSSPDKKVNAVSQSKVKMVNHDERVQLEAQVNAEKRRAVGLKRAGKQAEALEALRLAKSLEKKLASLG
ncbi:phosphoinositide binding protein [Wolffia australiana]